MKDDPVPGHFYREQLRVAPDPEKILYEIEDELKHRTRKGQKETLVKYLFYPQKFNEWTSNENFVQGADNDVPPAKKKRNK